ncbi:hypothetical protein GCM10010992_14320 [Cloacibacterium rupense]|uniref:Tetratricopeptide repeat-containing protein n=1 Tax=Cloacibacterium rupense TaxID=517423 RepID=A0ABQ2NJB5_9FLAO|nr:hypothetical protein [Cloacibacterium rupense]GGP03950.1 hypothetical protein GCM10010992_14320 [Cloacibacterium rupense]
MNARVLELIQRPENISAEDISVLQSEIDKFPYMQSIRTLYLSAIHQFNTENYHQELTKTAAYTTDKKILYHFINFKKENEKKEPTKFKKINLVKETETPNQAIPETIVEEKTSEKQANKIVENTENESSIPNKLGDEISKDSTISSENLETITSETEEIKAEKPVETHPISVVGDTEIETPILDKKENEFEVFNEEVNLELENKIFAELAAEEEKQNDIFRTREGDLNYSKDIVLEHLDQIKETNITPAEISFNAFDSFLPDVKFSIPSKTEEPVIQEITTEKAEEKTSSEQDINFNQIQEFEIQPELVVVKEEVATISETKEEVVEVEEKIEIIEETSEPEVAFEWKPMTFVQNPLDAHIKTSAPEKQESIIPNIKKTIFPEAKPVEIKPIEEIKQDDIVAEQTSEIEEKPIINISFFGNKVSEMAAEEQMIKETEEVVIEEKIEDTSSNIPNFVNTWQNWLKIDRREMPKTEPEPAKIIEKKAEIIDKFIEENPKISQLKEDAHYVVKEKAGDISHLMTETLAKLYVEQRLYTKAITAYEALKKKHPERQDEFEVKIQEIKELRNHK